MDSLKPEHTSWTEPTPATTHAPVIKWFTNMLRPTPPSSGSDVLQVHKGSLVPGKTHASFTKQILHTFTSWRCLPIGCFFQPIHRTTVESPQVWYCPYWCVMDQWALFKNASQKQEDSPVTAKLWFHLYMKAGGLTRLQNTGWSNQSPPRQS